MAKAVCIPFNLTTEQEPMYTVFDSKDGYKDPHKAALDFWDSIKKDWPGWQSTYIVDEEAQKFT